MKLDIEMMKIAAKGTARISEGKDGFAFYRFNEEQEEYYRGNVHYVKTFFTAGVRLEFRTNSRSLALSVNAEEAATRKFFAFDIFTDGRKIGALTNIPEGGITFKEKVLMPTDPQLPLGEFSESFDIGEGEKTVCIYFPWSVKVTVHSVEIDDGASFEEVKKERQMLIFGDSITHGYDALYPSNAYSALLTDALCADARNKAIGGEIFCPDLAECSEDFEPDIITVAYGSNDWNSFERADFEDRCDRFFAALSKNYPGAKIFAITPIWRRDGGAEKPCGSLDSVREFIAGMSKKYPNVIPINGEALVPKDPKYFSDFRLHPNDEGFAFYAKAITEEIKKHI